MIALNVFFSGQVFSSSLITEGTLEVKTLKCPGVQNEHDRIYYYRDAFVKAYKKGDGQYYVSERPVFLIRGVYVYGKVLCDNGPIGGHCFSVGNTKSRGQIEMEGNDLMILSLPIYGDLIKFKCDLSLLNKNIQN